MQIINLLIYCIELVDRRWILWINKKWTLHSLLIKNKQTASSWQCDESHDPPKHGRAEIQGNETKRNPTPKGHRTQIDLGTARKNDALVIIGSAAKLKNRDHKHSFRYFHPAGTTDETDSATKEDQINYLIGQECLSAST